MAMVPKMALDRLLVKPADKRITRGGIELPNSVTGISALEGTVVGLGPDVSKATKLGDEIAFPPYGKYVVPAIEGAYMNHFIVNEKDIIFYWEEKEDA